MPLLLPFSPSAVRFSRSLIHFLFYRLCPHLQGTLQKRPSCPLCATDPRGSTGSSSRPTSAGRSCRSSTGASRTSVQDPELLPSHLRSSPLLLLLLHRSATLKLLMSQQAVCSCVIVCFPRRQECPSGVVNEETFKGIYSKFFPQGGPSHLHQLLKSVTKSKNLESLRLSGF